MSIPIPIPAGTGPPIPAAIPAPFPVPRRPAAAKRRWLRWSRWPYLLGALLVLGAVFVARRMLAPARVATTVATEVVGLHDISQTVDATGSVQAVEVVEIKSKASGQILQMPVAIGSVVKAGDLLAQIDPLTVRNQYDQLLAALSAAQANVTITSAQKQRAEELYSREAMTAMDHESAQGAAANALAALARARADLQIARRSLDDATVRAPSAGTIVEQDATKGMVITSGTSSVSGGTTLFKIADLDRIQIHTLVGETDVGNLRPGMTASVTVDAFPSRTFAGRVIKVEPQAVLQQSVTLFPVVVAIENENGRLLPGMNGQVTIDIAHRSQVAAVPLDALRGLRELPAVAAALGLDPDVLRAQLARQASLRVASLVPGTTDNNRARRRGGATRGGARDGAATGGSRAQFVLVQVGGGLEARQVRLGISDFDYAEVLGGVKAGERVALLGVAEQTAKRAEQQAQLAKRMGSGLPGSSGAGGGTGGARSGGGGR